MNTPFYPEKIWVEKRAASSPATNEILARLEGVPVEWIDTIHKALTSTGRAPEEKILVLAKQEGRFLKPCPGTHRYVCCNYYFLNLATNCDVDCSYCILQGYLNNPYLTVYTNLEAMYREVEQVLRADINRFYRIGTGELTDSLSLDHLTAYSQKLIPFFLRFSNAVLELKTKTTGIQHLLSFSPQRRVVVSWSLNPDELIQREERNAPFLSDRLEAAKQCARAGYLLGFHFDPLIHYDHWEAGYHEVVRQLFSSISGEDIVWISLGALRYPREMDGVVRERHPESEIVLGEMFPGKDGKLRYFRPLRQLMFRRMVQWIREEDPRVQIYLCMESPQVWSYAFGDQPLARCGLPDQLDQAVFRCRRPLPLD